MYLPCTEVSTRAVHMIKTALVAPPLLQHFGGSLSGKTDKRPLSNTVLPVVRVPGQERRLLETMQLAIGEFITASSQGLPPSPRVWGGKGPEPQFSWVFIRSKKAAGSWHKWIGYTAGSWHKRIGYTAARQFFFWPNVGLSAFPW